MKRQFLQIGKVRADASEMEAFSFVLACFASLGTRCARLFAFRQSYPRKRGLALHLGFAQGAVCEYSSPFAKRKSIGTSSALFNTHNVAKRVLE